MSTASARVGPAPALPAIGMPVPTTPNPESPTHPVPPPQPPHRHIHDPDPWKPPAPVEDPPAQPDEPTLQ